MEKEKYTVKSIMELVRKSVIKGIIHATDCQYRNNSVKIKNEGHEKTDIEVKVDELTVKVRIEGNKVEYAAWQGKNPITEGRICYIEIIEEDCTNFMDINIEYDVIDDFRELIYNLSNMEELGEGTYIDCDYFTGMTILNRYNRIYARRHSGAFIFI